MENNTYTVKLELEINSIAYNTLITLREMQNITMEEALERAIETDYYIKKETKEGSVILIQKPDKEIREVHIR